MSFSRRYLPAVLLACFGLTVSLFAQSTTKPTSKALRGTVSGRVTIKDKGAAGVAVGLRKSEVNNPFEPFLKATTDQDGFYRITNVLAGSYFVAPSAPAFVIADNTGGRGKSVVLGEGENVEGINFSLIRGGVITGKVMDADGRPVIQQRVSLYRADAFDQQAQQAQQQRPVFSSGGAQTDDRGIYRMYGLSAGRYKVATGRSDDVFAGTLALTRTSYKQVFYPDATEHTKATIIEVSEGSETKDVDIKLGALLQTFSVSGRVVNDETGLPVPNIRFGLQRMAGQRPEFVQTTLMANAQGDFFTEGLLPGKYGIFLFQEQNRDLRAESYSFDILDQGLTGVVIKLTKGASLSGVVVLDNEDKTLLQQLLKMRLSAYVTVPAGGPVGFGQSSTSPISPDGSFNLAGLPAGTANLSLGESMGPLDIKGFAISRIERDGVAMPRGIEVKEGEQVSGLRVVVSFGNATLRGLVKLENGSLPAGAQIFVRMTRVGEPLSGLRPPAVDARGRFLMEGIPPGNYELIVQVATGGGVRPRSTKREVNLQDGVVTDVEVTIDMDAKTIRIGRYGKA